MSIFDTSDYDTQYSVNKKKISDFIGSIHTTLFAKVTAIDGTMIEVDISDKVYSSNVNLMDNEGNALGKVKLRYINIANFNYKPLVGDVVMVLVPSEDNSTFLENKLDKNFVRFNLAQAVVLPIVLGQDTRNTPTRDVSIESKSKELDNINMKSKKLTITIGKSTIVVMDNKVTINAPSGVDITGATNITGDTKITGKLTVTGTTLVDDQIIANGINLSEHFHVDSQGGPTGLPKDTG